jgi:O-acetyl-ADP-ribose deacetylase (regulator of RNase III)
MCAMGKSRQIVIRQGDLTEADVDAIVNAANNDLMLGGGLAGTIRRRGGPAIQAQCDAHGPVQVGEAALTRGGNLPAKYVIHQASMSLGARTTAKALRDSTRAVLAIAEKTPDIRTLAFPAVGTGIAGFDLKECAEIMLDEVAKHSAARSKLTDIYFVLFDDYARQMFEEVWRQRQAQE